MLNITIPGFKKLELEHLVLDYNGTIATNGVLMDSVSSILQALSRDLHIHIITADSYGTAKNETKDLNCILTILAPEKQSMAKLKYIKKLDPKKTVVIGNGQNDHLMLKEAGVGIAVFNLEGTATKALHAADIVVIDIFAALALIQYPKRLISTLHE